MEPFNRNNTSGKKALSIKKQNIGIITSQEVTEPLTQASLSSFHSQDSETPRDLIKSFNKALSGNYDEAIVILDRKLCNPFELFKINFFSFSKLIMRNTTLEDIKWGETIQESGLISLNHYRKSKKIYSLIISDNCVYDIIYICYYLKYIDSKGVYIIRSDWKAIDVFNVNKDTLKYIIYKKTIKDGADLSPYFFPLELFFESEQNMEVKIHDIDVEHVYRRKGILSFSFKNYNRIYKYYGIEAVRDILYKNVVSITKKEKYCKILADRVTSSGKFRNYNPSEALRWLTNSYSQAEIQELLEEDEISGEDISSSISDDENSE